MNANSLSRLSDLQLGISKYTRYMHLSWSRWRLSGGRPAREQSAYESLGLVVRI